MTQPSYVSQISTTTATHNVSMINLGETNEGSPGSFGPSGDAEVVNTLSSQDLGNLRGDYMKGSLGIYL